MNCNKIALICLTDGRWQYLARTLESALNAGVFEEISEAVLIDDSSEHMPSDLVASCNKRFSKTISRTHDGERFGFCGAIQRAWSSIKGYDYDFVFHLEDDFTFNERVDIPEMARILREHGYLAQM